MAAATGQTVWIDRYRTFEPALDAAITTAAGIAQSPAVAQALRQAYDRWVNQRERHSVEIRKQGAKPWQYTRIEFSGPTPEGDVRQRQYQWEFVECYFWPEERKSAFIASQPVAQL